MSPALTKILFLSCILSAVLIEALADVFFKRWALESKTWLIVLGMVLYALGTLFWAFSLRYEMLSKAISIFTVLNLLIITLVGVLYFNEELLTVHKVGIALAVVSIICLEWQA